MKLPDGQLVRSRVITDPRTVLVDALDREMTGYAVLEPQESVLLDGDGAGVVTFEAGVPVVAFHTGTERGGPPALADLAAEGPYRLELFEVGAARIAEIHGIDRFRVPSGMPAERLVGDQSLAERTRGAAPPERVPGRSRASASTTERGEGQVQAEQPGRECRDERSSSAGESSATEDRQPGAVEAFLDDENKIERLREAAREEASERAEEWGFDDLRE